MDASHMAGDHPMSLRNYLTKVVKLWCPRKWMNRNLLTIMGSVCDVGGYGMQATYTSRDDV